MEDGMRKIESICIVIQDGVGHYYKVGQNATEIIFESRQVSNDGFKGVYVVKDNDNVICEISQSCPTIITYKTL